MIERTLRELRYAARTLVRTPGASALMLLVLGLALAGNIVLFSIIDTTLMASPPVPDVDRFVNIYTVRRNGGHGGLSYPDYVDLGDALRSSRTVEDVFGYGGLSASMAIEGQRPDVVFGELVTANYFRATRAPLVLGSPDLGADTPGTEPRVIIGYRFWQRRFGGSPAVLNQTVRINGLLFTIGGVAAREFTGLLFNGLAADVWAPLSQLERFRGDVRDDRSERWLFVKARLRDEVTPAQASAVADVVATQLRQRYPASNEDRIFRVLATSDVMINPEADPALRTLAIAIVTLGTLVLAIAAANIAGVLLARMTLRRRELAVRVSLGASRRQLTLSLAAEALLLSIVTLAIGFALSAAALAALQSWQPPLPIPLGWTFAIDRRVILFATAVTMLTMTLVAMLPAWRATRFDPLTAMRGSPAAGRRRWFSREGLLIPQVALSLVLLVVAGLFTRSLQQASQLELGFSAGDTAVIAANPRLSGYDPTRAEQFWMAMLDRVRADGGIRAAALTDRIPLDLYGSRSTSVRTAPGAQPITMQLAGVGEGYFDVFGIRLVGGRDFQPSELQASAVAIVSETAASELWPGQQAIGQRMQLSDSEQWRTVIGVVNDVLLLESLGEQGSPLVYIPLPSEHVPMLRVAAAARPGVADVPRRLKAAADAVDPNVAVFETRSLREHISTMLLPFRAAAWTALAAGVFGLLLTLAGIAGSVLHVVAARVREIGIRVALGGTRGHVTRAVTGPAARATLVGLIAGWLASIAAAQGLAGFLFGIGALDPLTLTLVPGGFVLVVLLTSIAPVRRAFRVDPAVVLREE